MHAYFGRYFNDFRGCGGRYGRPRVFAGVLGALGDGPGFGWHGFRSGRKLGSDELQLVLLALLAEKPCHGYEIIKALEERSGGFYSPSPGMIYPALTLLEELGYASVETEGAKKRYAITPEGRAHLDANHEIADAILARLEWIASKMEHVKRAFSGETDQGDDDGSILGKRAKRQMIDELDQARRALKSALRAKFFASEEEQQRVAEILKRAADEIAKL